MTRSIYVILTALTLLAMPVQAMEVSTLGLKGDGVTDDTDALQKALGDGGVELVLPKGVYLLGTVDIPGKVTLRGEPGAVIRVNTNRLAGYDRHPEETVPVVHRRPANSRCVLALRGDDIRIEGLAFDFALTEQEGVKADQRPAALVWCENCRHVTLSRLIAERPAPAPLIPVEQRKARGVGGGRYPSGKELPASKAAFDLSSFRNCENVVLEDSRATHLSAMIELYQCARIVSRGNWAEDCYAITCCRSGDAFLHHVGNWSRNVTHQCRWWGGNANDKRSLEPGDVGWGTATTVVRGPSDSDADYNPYTAGAFDILVAHNYAEHGQTLAWGAKGRQIIFQGNIGRFFSDYGLGSEGGENVIYDSNVIINGMSGGLTTMYWAEKLVMTGNIVLTRDEPIDMRYSRYSNPQAYQGPLIRLHFASSPSGSGAGQAIISGNLFSCELPESRSLAIQAGRDVQITGNKIRNGRIVKKGHGRLLVNDNDFTMTVSDAVPWIVLPRETNEFILRGNVFRSLAPTEGRSPTEMLILAEADDRSGESPLRAIEDNQITGFPLAIWLRSFAKEHASRFVVRDNFLDGKIRVEGLEGSRRLLDADNFHSDTLTAVRTETLNRQVEPLPEPVPAVGQTQNNGPSDEQRGKASHDVR